MPCAPCPWLATRRCPTSRAARHKFREKYGAMAQRVAVLKEQLLAQHAAAEAARRQAEEWEMRAQAAAAAQVGGADGARLRRGAA